MNRLYILASGLIITILFTALACKPQATTGQVSTSKQDAPQPVVEKPLSEWEQLIKDAKREGNLTIYTSSGATVTKALRGFTDRYGIPIEIVSLQGAEANEKIRRERRAGLYLLDVYVGGPATPLFLKEDGIWDPVREILIPEIIEPKKWLGGDLHFLDTEQKYVLAFLSFLAVPLIANSNMVKPDEIKSYQDLLNPKWKGNIVMLDPSRPGFPGQWFQVFGFEMMGLDYMRALAKQNPVIVQDKKTPADWVAKGKMAIALGVSPEIIKEYTDVGAPVVRLPHMKEGTYASSGGGNLTIMNKRPHPYAARLFSHWLLSKEGQTLFSKAYAVPSARTDVPNADLGIDPLHVPDPKGSYLWADDEKIRVWQADRLKVAGEIFGPLMGR